MKLQQIVLPSGRAVQYRELGPREIDNLSLDAAKLAAVDPVTMAADPLAAKIAYQKAKESLGVDAILVNVSTTLCTEVDVPAEPKDTYPERYKAAEDIMLEALQWEPYDSEPGEPAKPKYNATFSAKDHIVLQAIFDQAHTVTMGDVNSIMGKARTVTKK